MSIKALYFSNFNYSSIMIMPNIIKKYIFFIYILYKFSFFINFIRIINQHIFFFFYFKIIKYNK